MFLSRSTRCITFVWPVICLVIVSATSCSLEPAPFLSSDPQDSQKTSQRQLPDKKITQKTDSAKQNFAKHREQMVANQMVARNITDQRVLNAVKRIPRHEFVPPEIREHAYADSPLPIGYGKTISQPFIVALMSSLIRPQPADRVLEVGTGCGYQAAVLSEVVSDVYSIELEPVLARGATERLKRLGYDNVHVRTGDGAAG